jgi:hypothetical protein
MCDALDTALSSKAFVRSGQHAEPAFTPFAEVPADGRLTG